MNRQITALLGILSIVPVTYPLFLFLLTQTYGASDLSGAASLIWSLIPLHIAVWFSFVGLLLFYSAFLIRSKTIAVHEKMLWMAFLYIGHFFAIPVFWWIHFWSVSNDGGGQ
jgi:hypothetical protein